MKDPRKESDSGRHGPINLGKADPDRHPDPRSGNDATEKSAATDLAQTPDTAASIGGWMIFMLWVIVLAAGTLYANNWLETRDQNREGVWVADQQGAQALLLRANRFGQFRVRGSANGQEVTFLIDTGASGISIPQTVADELGLHRGRAFKVSTANGVRTVYATTLESLSIGPLSRRDVQAHINPGMEGDVGLLGMSFLRDFEIVHKDGEMVIRE